MANLRHRSQEMQASFWFVPAVIVVRAVALATGLIALDANVELHVDKKWPLLFGAGAAGSRGLLTAVASSMITVAGVVFSITIVALSLTSSQYTSRVLRNFMRDRMNQVVLGVFVGIFAYCLVTLRSIRGSDEGAFVPSLAVIGGLALAFVGIAFLIYFIHHISMSIQASSIIAAVAHETIAAVDRLFPEELIDNPNEDAERNLASALGERLGSVVRARKMGYVQSIDGDALLALARKHGTMVRMERGVGEFVVEGVPLVSRGARQVGRRDGGRVERRLRHQPPPHDATRCRLRHPANRRHRHVSAVARGERHHDRSDVRGLSGRDPLSAGGPRDWSTPPPGPG